MESPDSGLRGNKGAPSGQEDRTRDPLSLPVSTVQALIDEMREAVRNAGRPYPIAIFHESVTAWADQLAALLASPSLQTQEKEEDTATRGVDTQYPSNPLATAASNEVGPAVPGCNCPAATGEDCPLTQDECDARSRDYLGHPWFGARLRRIWDGFVMESLNGVVCSIPDTGLNTPPHRTWCVRCQRRYMELSAIVNMLDNDGTKLVADYAGSGAPRTVNGDARDPDPASPSLHRQEQKD